MLFTSHQIQIWQWCETLRLYPTNLLYHIRNRFLNNMLVSLSPLRPCPPLSQTDTPKKKKTPTRKQTCNTRNLCDRKVGFTRNISFAVLDLIFFLVFTTFLFVHGQKSIRTMVNLKCFHIFSNLHSSWIFTSFLQLQQLKWRQKATHNFTYVASISFPRFYTSLNFYVYTYYIVLSKM
jgi:hypothetical protein